MPAGALLTLAGYFGPWIGHPVAGLVVTGLDLGEYVKFLPSVVGGEVTLWREGFYLPLVTASLALSLNAFRAQYGYGWPLRATLLAVAVIAALNMLPPAWTPQRMLTPEFRLQAAAIGLCLLAVGFCPFLALLPGRLTGTIVAILATTAIWFPLQGFLRVLPDIELIFNQPQHAAWGPYVMIAGLVVIFLVCATPWYVASGTSAASDVGG